MTYRPVGTQADVIATDAPVVVVLGGAGTGKTTTAAAAAAHFLREADRARGEVRAAIRGHRGKQPARSRVLFLSFSRTSVAQVIDRAATIVGPLMNRIEVVTFHGLAWRIINNFGPAYGYSSSARILSAAEQRVPGAPAGLGYSDLIPTALELLAKPTIASHYAARYSLIVCDEFQDTDDEEWRFLQTVSPTARRVLLGDVNQCIYAEMKGIDPDARIAEALAVQGAARIDLPPASHRDPTGVLPAAAAASRERRFDDHAIRTAVEGERLIVQRLIFPDTAAARVTEIVRRERADRHTVSVFTHTNTEATALSDALTEAGVNHEQTGLSEAYGEALMAQLALLQFALDGTPGRRQLAVFVASNYRYDAPIVSQIMNRSNAAFERALAVVVEELKAAANPLDVGRLADVIENSYARLGTHRGQSTWQEAARRLRAAMRLLTPGSDSFHLVAEDLEGRRNNTLVGDAGVRTQPVQVMNLHQTKGREADATILVLRPDEYHGKEKAPYPKLSRLLYVVMTRARARAYIIVPDNVHPLWQPLVEACEGVTTASRTSR